MRKGLSVLLCVVMLLMTGSTTVQAKNLDSGDASGLKTAQLTAKDNRSGEPEGADVVIQVAVTVELDGVLEAFGEKDPERCYDTADKYNFSYYRFKRNDKDIVVVMQPYMGMTYCSSLCTRAILAFKPDIVCMVGICAGRASKVNLGDIVIASSVFDYAEGKQYEDKFAARPKTRPMEYMLSEYISSEIADNKDLVKKICDGYPKAPKDVNISFHSMASGVVVVDDPTVMERIAQLQDDTVALDMEAYALATAADLMDTKWMVIKTVQDFADGNKAATEGDIRPFAAYSSAKLLEIILEDIDATDWDKIVEN